MRLGKHRREGQSTADGPAATESELVDRSWEAFDAELVGSHSFSGLTKRLPFLFGYFARIAWESSRVNCVSMAAADLINGSMSVLRLLGTTSVLTALFASAPTLSRVKAALPALLFILGVSIFRTVMTLIADWNEDRLMPDVARTVERRLYAATTQVELAAFDTPGFYDALQRARGRGQSEATHVIQLAISMLTGLVSLLAAIFVLGMLSPLLVPLTLVAALPDAWAALRSARMRYQVSYELGVRRAAQADPGRPDGGPLGRGRGAVVQHARLPAALLRRPRVVRAQRTAAPGPPPVPGTAAPATRRAASGSASCTWCSACLWPLAGSGCRRRARRC